MREVTTTTTTQSLKTLSVMTISDDVHAQQHTDTLQCLPPGD